MLLLGMGLCDIVGPALLSGLGAARHRHDYQRISAIMSERVITEPERCRLRHDSKPTIKDISPISVAALPGRMFAERVYQSGVATSGNVGVSTPESFACRKPGVHTAESWGGSEPGVHTAESWGGSESWRAYRGELGWLGTWRAYCGELPSHGWLSAS